MKKIILLSLCMLLSCGFVAAKEYKLTSPSSQISVVVTADKSLTWAVDYGSEKILEPSQIAIDIKGYSDIFGDKMRVVKSKYTSVDEMLHAVVPTKFREVRDHYNELTLTLKGGVSVIFRAYDSGVAYRFVSNIAKDNIYVNSETSDFNFAQEGTAYWANETNKDFISHCEAFFKPLKFSEIEADKYCYLPVSIQTPEGTRVVITETDLFDYPNQFVFAGNGNNLTSQFPNVILEAKLRGDRDEDVVSKADYIAQTSGKRKFPWRILTIGDDRSLLENTLSWQLASAEVSDDTDWIRPGQISWEWWCALNVYGVDFVAGVNTQTYKYYIDFASKYGIEYILLDEGWSQSTTNIKEPKDDLDLQGLIQYGAERGVGVILWTLWNPMRQDIEGILDRYQEWGVKGIKIDFMQRCDQDMVNFYEQIAAECFDRHLLVDYHGSYKPSGLQRTYPNVMTFEGVYGMEHDKCSYDISPEHDLVLPFTRMVAGPMDYTPGATINGTKDDFVERWYHPMSQGTRAHQAAIYITYESPLQMLCDSPSSYYREHEFTSFITQVPTVWDQTCALEAKAGDYLLIARRSGEKWYVAGLNDWNERELPLTLDFLDDKLYDVEIFRDGVNANVWASDYKVEHVTAKKGDSMQVKMANGGGWAAIFTPRE